MDSALARLIVSSFTLACQGTYTPVTHRKIPPTSYVRSTKATLPTVLGHASVAADFEALSIFYSKLGDRDNALCCGSLAVGMQHFLAGHIRTIFCTIKQVHLHVVKDGTVYVRQEKPPAKAAEWGLPKDHILSTWSDDLIKVMMQTFNFDSPPVQGPTTRKGLNFTVAPRDPRILLVNKIYQAVNACTAENGDPIYKEIWARSNIFLLSMLSHLIYATADLPKGFAPASIGFKDGIITGRILAE